MISTFRKEFIQSRPCILHYLIDKYPEKGWLADFTYYRKNIPLSIFENMRISLYG